MRRTEGNIIEQADLIVVGGWIEEGCFKEQSYYSLDTGMNVYIGFRSGAKRLNSTDTLDDAM